MSGNDDADSGSAKTGFSCAEAMAFAGIGLIRYSLGGIVLNMDDCAYRMLELEERFASPADTVGHALRDVFRYVMNEGFLRELIRTQGAVRGCEYPFRTWGGAEKWVLVHALLVADPRGQDAVQAILQDITARKRQEERLRDALSRFESVMENTPMVAIQGFDRDGVVRHWNRAAERFYGFSKDEVLGKRLTEHPLWGKESTEFERLFRQVWQTGHPLEAREWKVFTREGETRWVYSSLFPIVQRDGIAEVFCMDVDITGQKAAEHDRRTLEVQIQHTQRLESLGALAGGIAHEFNNILMGILGHAELGLLSLDHHKDVQTHFRQIVESTERAADLTKRLLTYSGQGNFSFQPVDLSRLIASMHSLLEVSKPKKIELVYELDTALPPVYGDVSQLHQLVLNLVTNAAEAIGSEAGSIRVRTGRQFFDAKTLARASFPEQGHEGEYVVLEVSDTGCGMDEPTLARIFDPFFSTKFIGRGLGLAATVGIVRAHQGLILAESQPGQGATFRILFPENSARAPGAHPGDLQGTGRKILLVDDELEVRRVIGEFLEQHGYEVVTAPDGVEAVKTFERTKDLFGVVLLDLKMPRMDGEETFRLLRQIQPGIPVLLLSGYAEQEALRIFEGKGISGFVQKPCPVQAILSKVEEALGETPVSKAF